MGEFVLHDPFNELHGKLSKKNGRVEYMYRRGTDYRYTSMKRQLTRRERAARKGAMSEAQAAACTKFTAAANAARSRMTDPKQMAADAVAFKQQNRYPTLYGYLSAEEYKKLTE